jgi:hypothetical protein
MATKAITFTVTPTGKISGFWIAVGNRDVPLADGVGRLSLNVGEEYALFWHMVGNGGSGIGIVGKDAAGNEVVTLKQSTIQAGRTAGAGFMWFTVS